MKLAVTGAVTADAFSPIVLRGPYESIFKTASAIGYDGVELHTDKPELEDGEYLRRAAAKYGLDVTALGTGGAYSRQNIFLASEEETIRKRAVDYIKEHTELAQILGCNVIIGLIKGKISQCSSREVYLKQLRKSLEDCVDFAEQKKVILVLEMINRYESDIFNRIEEGMEFIQTFRSKNLKLHLDFFHMNLEEGNIAKAIQQAEGLIGYVHAADSDRWYAGHAHYDFKDTINALRKTGYDGVISVESYSFPAPEISAEKSWQTLHKWI